MPRKTGLTRPLIFALAAILASACAAAPAQSQSPSQSQSQAQSQATPTASQSVGGDTARPEPVRNQAAALDQIGADGIVTLRYWKIRKGSFPEFLAASENGVWPYFEKIGSRVIGMWQVLPTPGEAEASADYDEVYLATRYASVEHWAATRDAVSLGGDGPDYQALQDALAIRRDLTIETRLTFLSGATGPMGPYFLPGTMEAFEAVE